MFPAERRPLTPARSPTELDTKPSPPRGVPATRANATAQEVFMILEHSRKSMQWRIFHFQALLRCSICVRRRVLKQNCQYFSRGRLSALANLAPEQRPTQPTELRSRAEGGRRWKLLGWSLRYISEFSSRNQLYQCCVS